MKLMQLYIYYVNKHEQGITRLLDNLHLHIYTLSQRDTFTLNNRSYTHLAYTRLNTLGL